MLAILARRILVPSPIDIAPRSLEDAFLPPGPDIAARFCAHLGTEFDMDGPPGLADKAELLNGNQVRLTLPRRRHRSADARGRANPGVAARVRPRRGQWLVDPIRRHDLPSIEMIDLSPLLSDDG